MNNLQKYIKEITGVDLKLKLLPKKMLDKLPVYLRTNLKVGEVAGREVIFAIKQNLTPEQYKKQAEIIEKNTLKPVVFVFDNIESYNRKRLIQKKIGFIVPGRQMYLPQLFIDIKDFGSTQLKKSEKLFPAAQCLMFYHLLGNKVADNNFKTIAKKINYGTMTITRAANVLASFNLCRIEGGKEKSLVFEKSRKQLWEEVQTYLIDPVDKELYTDDNCEFNFIYKAGINALSHYTEIAGTDKNLYAVSYENWKSLLEKRKLNFIKSPDTGTTIQVWKYDPGVLADGIIVDPLSLYLTMKDNDNERVQGELNKLLESLW